VTESPSAAYDGNSIAARAFSSAVPLRLMLSGISFNGPKVAFRATDHTDHVLLGRGEYVPVESLRLAG